MDIQKIPNEYRPVPFWSWNEKLDTEEIRRQIQLMQEAGIGGFFMHARGGLQTEYMGEEWFDNVAAGIAKAKELGMYAWAYDENGWPSGFGGGKVNGKGERYCQKYLRMGERPDREAHVIAWVDGVCFYYEVNPFYVDTLDSFVTEDFIREIYEPYYARFGNEMTGFFTDEPQISRSGIPWSFVLSEEYWIRYQDRLEPHLPELFREQGAYQTTRVRFWKLVTDLFSQNFCRKIYDWCESRGLKLTGHLVCEETFLSQLTSNGAVMPHYEYLSIPGMDCLGRQILYDLTSYQLGSAAQQLGKKQVLSETFAICGHNVSFDELRVIYSHQMIHGVNLLCPHLEGYSLRGIRKRDYPPAMFYQQPWWPEYEKFCTAMARVGQILAEGECECDTLLLHPQTSAWILFDNGENRGLEELYQEFQQIVSDMDAKHIPFHLGDETLMERHGRVKGKRLIIGRMAYSTIVIPRHIRFLENTERLLAELRANGGRIIQPEELTAREDVVDNPHILYTKRKLKKEDVYFLLNHTDQPQSARIQPGCCIVNQETGEKLPFTGQYDFAPYESLLLLDDGTPRRKQEQTEKKRLELPGEWKLEAASPNTLTLDRCDYYFDGQLQEKNGYVLNIQNRALALERPVQIRQEYHVQVDTVPEEVYLVCETPERFAIRVNGRNLSTRPCGWFVDKAFQKLDIRGLLQKGENTISFDTVFWQSEEVYACLRKAAVFESEKNKLTYDMEIEPCYLVGAFGVRLEGEIQNLDRNAFRFRGSFTICDLPDADYEIALKRKGINAVRVRLNGAEAGNILYQSDRIDGSAFLKPGENRIELQLYNNLRNMLGPHHLQEGESYAVGPASFFKEDCVWFSWRQGCWNEDYCFVQMSAESLMPDGTKLTERQSCGASV